MTDHHEPDHEPGRDLEALIEQIRQTGLDQANDIADRYADRADGHRQNGGSPSPDHRQSAAAGGTSEHEAAAIGGVSRGPGQTQQARRAVDAAMALLPDLFDLLRQGLDDRDRPMADGHPDVVALPEVSRGGSASATLWVNPRPGSPSGSIRFFATDLHTHDGVVLAGDVLALEPESIATGGDAEAEPVLVQVTAPIDAAPGQYHGLILAHGLPAAAQRVLVVVR